MAEKLIANLIGFIRSNYSPQEKLKPIKGGGQTIFFRKSGKSLCYIEDKGDKSIVTVVVGATLDGKVQSANLSLKTKEMFKKAKQFHDGKWLFFEVKTKSDIKDIETLLMIKRPITKRI